VAPTAGQTFAFTEVRFTIMQVEELLEKIKSLPPERIAEVEDFVDFLALRDDRRLVQAATKISEDSFREIWDNEEDAAYNTL
jgi:hypothetical protein